MLPDPVARRSVSSILVLRFDDERRIIHVMPLVACEAYGRSAGGGRPGPAGDGGPAPQRHGWVDKGRYGALPAPVELGHGFHKRWASAPRHRSQIGRASCRERV